ncbi:hypothetical protein [Streptomyces nigrescens]|uniref:hypothetical protein n=1 Tax=Streptomyces nigrescens TaxID=1920 RepID=UPI0036F6570E
MASASLPAYHSPTRRPPMKSLDEVRAAFAKLPPDVTAKEIAEATGRAHIWNWSDPTKGFTGFPAPKEPVSRPPVRDRDAVLEWYEKQPFAQPDRRGPRDLTDAIRAARPTTSHLSASELAKVLGITRRAVNKYADRYTPDKTTDPFPQADSEGTRSWSAVRAWLLRHHDPLPKAGSWTAVREWLLRNQADGTESKAGRVFVDELGLTVGQRDLVERARVATAAGVSVPAEWLAELLSLDDPKQASQLMRGTGAVSPPVRRLKPTALARELGVSLETVKYYAKTRTPEKTADPFPEKDSSSARDVAEVRAWFERNK